MSVEVNPVNVHCQMACTYCYETAERRAGKNSRPAGVDHAAVQAALIKVCGPDGFSLHGGEAFLADVADIEKLWAFGLEKYGKNGVQTSGVDITEEHFELIKKYKVHVGFSIDGPDELNNPRRRGDELRTLAATRRSCGWLLRCLADGVGCSVISTLHSENARGDRLPRLLDWWRDLDRHGMVSARLHLLERDGPGGEKLALSDDENVAALLAHRDLEANELKVLKFDLFRELESKLLDVDARVTCIFSGCDPAVTSSVQGVDADGSRSGCGRDSKDGRRWEPLQVSTAMRQVALWRTSQVDGGCRGCRFFLQCGGNCPGTAIKGDWRKRTQDCRVWFRLLEVIEADLVAKGQKPASMRADLNALVAERLGRRNRATGGHGDRPHGDKPYADHTDADHHNAQVKR